MSLCSCSKCPLTINNIHSSKWHSLHNEGNYLALVSALSSPPSCFLTEDFHQSHPPLLSSVVSSFFNPLMLQGLFLLGIEAKDVLPSKPKQSEDSSMQSTTVLKQGLVFCWYMSVCVSVSMCVCICVRRGGSYSPSNHLLLQLRKKKNQRQRQSVFMSVSARVVFSLSNLQLALSWQASPLPLSIHNGALRACSSPSLPPLALFCSALGL